MNYLANVYGNSMKKDLNFKDTDNTFLVPFTKEELEELLHMGTPRVMGIDIANRIKEKAKIILGIRKHLNG